jgi:hypothetical protein
MILYSCKVSQSNIIPTKADCFPYTSSVIPEIEPILINIFDTILPNETDEKSQKISFFYNRIIESRDADGGITKKQDTTNSKNMLLDIFRPIKESPESSFFANYIVNIFVELINFNYSNLDFVFNVMNKTFPETLILVLGPIIMHVVFVILFIASHLYAIYLWFSSMSWFFKKRDSNGNWGSIPWDDFEDSTFALFLVFIFVIILFPIGMPILFLISLFTFFYCLISIVLYVGFMNGKDTALFSILKKVFLYHKVTVMIILTIVLISNAKTYLGMVAAGVCLLCAVLFYWNIIPSNIYKAVMPPEGTLSPVNDDYSQPKKTCRGAKQYGGQGTSIQGRSIPIGKNVNMLNEKQLLKELKKMSKQ